MSDRRQVVGEVPAPVGPGNPSHPAMRVRGPTGLVAVTCVQVDYRSSQSRSAHPTAVPRALVREVDLGAGADDQDVPRESVTVTWIREWAVLLAAGTISTVVGVAVSVMPPG